MILLLTKRHEGNSHVLESLHSFTRIRCSHLLISLRFSCRSERVNGVGLGVPVCWLEIKAEDRRLGGGKKVRHGWFVYLV
jgi:hypothetical protein